MLFDYANKLALIEYNQEGMKPNHIEEYLTSFLPNLPHDLSFFKFEQVILSEDQESMFNAHEIRGIEIQLNTLDNDAISNRNRILYNALNNVMAFSNDTIAANTFTLKFDLGRKRNLSLNHGTIRMLSEMFDLDSDNVKKMKVMYKPTLGSQTKTIDLKQIGKKYSEKILEEYTEEPTATIIKNAISVLYDTTLTNVSDVCEVYNNGLAEYTPSIYRCVPSPENLVEVPPDEEPQNVNGEDTV